MKIFLGLITPEISRSQTHTHGLMVQKSIALDVKLAPR